MDVGVVEDEKTMLIENALKAYHFVNHRNPTTLDYRPEFARPSGSGRISRMPKNKTLYSDILSFISGLTSRVLFFVHNANRKKVPRFIGYKEFKSELRSCLSNKFVGSSNKLRVFLVFLNLFYKLVEINFFPFHINHTIIPTIKTFRLKKVL